LSINGYERFALDIKFIMGVNEGPSLTTNYLLLYQGINRFINNRTNRDFSPYREFALPEGTFSAISRPSYGRLSLSILTTFWLCQLPLYPLEYLLTGYTTHSQSTAIPPP